MIRSAFVLLLLAGLGALFFGLISTFVPDAGLNLTAAYYAAHTADDIGAANIVTAIIVTYRGLDTLGEVTVLFLAAAIVAMALKNDGHATTSRRSIWSGGGELLQTGTRLLTPLIFLFGAYIFVNGHLTPGGGFQGGAILASAVLMMMLSDPGKRISHTFISRLESVSGLAFISLGVLGIFLAGGFLDNRILPLGRFGELVSAGAIPLIYSFIGLKVGAELSSVLVSLSETEDA